MKKLFAMIRSNISVFLNYLFVFAFIAIMVYGEISARYPHVVSVNRMPGRKRRVRKQQGADFGDFVKKVAGGLQRANQFAKDNKLASKAFGVIDAAGLTDRLGSTGIGGIALKGLNAVKQAGYGRKRRLRAAAKRKILLG